MSFMSYEFEKYLSDYSTIKETLSNYGVAIIPLLNEEECTQMINDKWDLLEYLTEDLPIPIDRNNKETYKQILNLYPSHKMLLQHWKVGHSKLAWNVRKNPKVINIFKHLWGRSCVYDPPKVRVSLQFHRGGNRISGKND